MASIFHITTSAGQRIERRYEGNSAEQFAAYVAEFPIGSGATLRYTFSLAPQVPLVVLG